MRTLDTDKFDLFLSEWKRALKEPEDLFVGIGLFVNVIETPLGELAHELVRRVSSDTHYLALARRQDCECWTTDKSFWEAAKDQYPRLRWVGEDLQAGQEELGVGETAAEPAVEESS